MSPPPAPSERWRRIDELFHAAVELPRGEREVFLERACEGDRELRAEIEALLRADDSHPTFGEAIGEAARRLAGAPAGPGRRLAAGSRLGRYEVLRPLGAGGMGEVWRARDTRLGREVAIKVLPHELTSDPEALRRFEHEARAVAALSHPNILALHDFEREGEIVFAVTELLEGETLRERLRAGPVPPRKAREWGAQVARALAAAHDHGIVHRDVKPENLFITRGGVVKLLDFGVARQAPLGTAAEDPTLHTAAGVVLGTVGYMAPEQVRGEAADFRADVFALGCVLYELLTGERAFRGDSAPETLAAILRQDPPRLDELAGSSPELGRLLRRCLEKRPEDRFQSAHDLAFALEGGTVTSAPVVPARAARGRRGEWLAWAAAAAAALAAALGTGWLLRGAPPMAPPIRSTIELPEGTALDRLDGAVALSPDGSRLALVAYSASDNERRLYLRDLDDLQVEPLPGTEDASYPFWAPDGRAIGFFGDSKLKRIDLPGKVVRTLCDAPIGRGAAWSSRGVIAFAPGIAGGLFQVPAGGGAPTPLTAARPPTSHRLPHFLPDGRRLLYSVWRDEGDGSGVWLFDLESRRAQRLLPEASETQFVAPGYLAFVREGNLMLQPFDVDRAGIMGPAAVVAEKVHREPGRLATNVSFSQTGRLVYQLVDFGRQRLVWIGRHGERLATAAEVDGLIGLDLARDGRQVMLTVADAQLDRRLFLRDLERGVQSAATPDRSPATPIWSPDGRRIAYTDFSGSRARLRLRDVARGDPPRTLLEDAAYDYHPTGWSPDGKTLVLMRVGSSGTQFDLVALDLQGERPRPLVEGPAQEAGGQVSPGGGWLSFISDESGRPELYVVSFPTSGRRWPITSGGVLLFGMAWLGEDELAYFAADGRGFRVELAMRGDRLQVGAPRRAFGEFTMNTSSVVDAEVDPATGRLLVAEIGRPEGGPLVLLSDWRAELARR